MSDQLDQLCINTVRFLSADAVQKAQSGHTPTRWAWRSPKRNWQRVQKLMSLEG